MSNEGIINELLSTAEYYDSIGDDGRCHAYKRAVESIREYGRTITSGEQAKQLKWIGDGIGGKIDSILESGGTGRKSGAAKKKVKVSRLRSRHSHHSRSKKRASPVHSQRVQRNSPQRAQHVSVMLIDDIRSKAKKRKNETSIDAFDKRDKRDKRVRSPLRRTSYTRKNQAQKAKSKLNRNSRTLRIKQYEYTLKPENDATVVSRAEIDQFVTCVKKVWDKLIQKQSSKGVRYRGKIQCCGGFRRGQTLCHECVIVLCSDMSSARQRYLFKELIRVLYKIKLIDTKRLQDSDYYQGVLDISKLFKSQRTGDYPSKRSNVPLVLRLTDEGSWPCTLLRWTGPKNYWIKLQSAAQRQNFELLENGLYSRGSGGRGGLGKKLYHRDEYDVLTDLDMGYLEPIYRR